MKTASWIAFAVAVYTLTWLAYAAPAHASVCPVVEYVCEAPQLWEGLDEAGATTDELAAIGIIVDSTVGERTPVDWYEGPRRVGWPHFTGEDPLDIGCDDDLVILGALYSEHGSSIGLAAWRDRMAPARSVARRNDTDMALALVLSNSMGARGYTDLAASCDHNEECMLVGYANGSAHRARRIRRLRE